MVFSDFGAIMDIAAIPDHAVVAVVMVPNLYEVVSSSICGGWWEMLASQAGIPCIWLQRISNSTTLLPIAGVCGNAVQKA